MKTMIKAITIAAMVVVAGLVVLTTLPEFSGYRALIVTTGSMEPTIKVGGMVFVKKITAYSAGDIITFQQGPDQRSLTTHRIIDIKDVNGRKMFKTKGDAVNQPDDELVPENRVAGKVTFWLPFVGRPIAFAKTQLGVVMLVVIPAAIIVYEELKKIRKEINKSYKRL